MNISREREKINRRIRRIKNTLGIAITETSYRDLFTEILYPLSSHKSGEIKPLKDTKLSKEEYINLLDIFKKSTVGKQTYYKEALQYKVDVGEKRIAALLNEDINFRKKWKRLSNLNKFKLLSDVGIAAARYYSEGKYEDFQRILTEWIDSYEHT